MLPTSPSPTRPPSSSGPGLNRRSEGLPLPLELDPDARYFLWIDPHGLGQGKDRPRPTLVMVLARTAAGDGVPQADDRLALAHFLALTQLEAQYHWPGGPNPEEVHWVGQGAQSFRAPIGDDRRWSERVLLAYGPQLEERSRRRTGPGPDRSVPPTAFERRLALQMSARELPRGAWIDTPGLLDKVQANLHIRDRWLLAPGAEGRVRWWGTSVEARVPETDLHFRGSPLVKAPVVFPPELVTLAALLSAPVQTERGMTGGERVVEQKSAVELCFGERPLPLCLEATMNPLGDEPLVEGPHFRLEREEAADGEVLVVRLHDVLVAAPGESLLGWSLDVGFRDREGFEPWSRQLFKCGGRSSGAQALAAALPHGRHGRLELIVRNSDGLPVHRRSLLL
ncbi:MAG: hypothetical protein IPG45_36455 [Deltaproteobacteria bacterium]|nr:hypothetical protein [Deltaproteobacteria bacterium]